MLPLLVGLLLWGVSLPILLTAAWFLGRGPAYLMTAAWGVTACVLVSRQAALGAWSVVGCVTFLGCSILIVEFTATRRRALDVLRETQQRFQLIATTLPQVLWIQTLRPEKLVYLSPGFEPLWGQPEGEFLAEPRRWLDCLHPEDRPTVAARYEAWITEAAGDRLDLEYRILRPDGTCRWLHVHGVLARNARGIACGACGIAEDVTEHRQMQESLAEAKVELAHVSQLTTMGVLTASIAHEVNQPLAAIVSNACASLRWLGRSPPDAREAREAISRIIADSQRAATIIERVRALSRRAPVAREPVSVNDVVVEALNLVTPEAEKSRISVLPVLAPGLPEVLADRVQLLQVLLNLTINALDSLRTAQDGPRTLRISSGEEGPGRLYVAVADSGPGVDAQAHAHLFEPLFSTKPRGMGMGLAISRSIVESHGGRLSVVPNAPRGAVFRFTLPAAPRKAA